MNTLTVVGWPSESLPPDIFSSRNNYVWDDNPAETNLKNKEDMPTSTFKTEV